MTISRLVLGSRSPQRRQLLSQLLPACEIVVEPPASAVESTLQGLSSWPELRRRLCEIATTKWAQVRRQRGPAGDDDIVLTADTTIVVETTPFARTSWQQSTTLRALEQPCETGNWRDEVRAWFTEYYAGKTHWAATAVCLGRSAVNFECDVVTTAVTMRPDAAEWIEWYLGTEEPRGKAGGYAIQGAGSLFITRIEGSPSNVIGLPVEWVAERVFGE